MKQKKDFSIKLFCAERQSGCEDRQHAEPKNNNGSVGK